MLTKNAQAHEEIASRMQTMRGNGVLTKLMRSVEVRPNRQSVIKSPRQAAIGGAILSMVYYLLLI